MEKKSKREEFSYIIDEDNRIMEEKRFNELTVELVNAVKKMIDRKLADRPILSWKNLIDNKDICMFYDTVHEITGIEKNRTDKMHRLQKIKQWLRWNDLLNDEAFDWTCDTYKKYYDTATKKIFEERDKMYISKK